MEGKKRSGRGKEGGNEERGRRRRQGERKGGRERGGREYPAPTETSEYLPESATQIVQMGIYSIKSGCVAKHLTAK